MFHLIKSPIFRPLVIEIYRASAPRNNGVIERSLRKRNQSRNVARKEIAGFEPFVGLRSVNKPIRTDMQLRISTAAKNNRICQEAIRFMAPADERLLILILLLLLLKSPALTSRIF